MDTQTADNPPNGQVNDLLGSNPVNNLDQTALVEDIFDAMGVNLAPEEKGALMLKMIDTIQARTTSRLLERFDERQMAAFEQAVDSNDPNSLDSFFAAEAPDFAEVFEAETRRLRKELIDEFAGK